MDASTPKKVVAADRLNNSVIITFSDGRCGVYSSQLLYTMLGSARELHDPDNAEAEEAVATSSR